MTLAPTYCLVALSCVTAACDPIQIRGLTVAPTLSIDAESAQERAFVLASRIAVAHDLLPGPAAPFTGDEGWQCHHTRAIRLCGKVIADEVQFHFPEIRFSFSSRARSIWLELNEGPTATFGPDSVRECRWTERPDPDRPAGERAVLRDSCVPARRSS